MGNTLVMGPRGKTNALLLLAVAVAAPACSVSRAYRQQEHRETIERWPAEFQRAVKQGEVLKGMSGAMVRVAWGSPSETSSDPSGAFSYWLFPRGDKPALRVDAFPKDAGGDHRPPAANVEIELSKAEPAATTMVVFHGDHVVRMEQIKRER